ncbi:TIGR01620 family protein [Aliihoeflea aestuarii]|jgi:putative membrane protein|uniref:YcjF family protein n=1 Tax=Aliihoeflea aestuarii TaxID=453840 RepID=UPI00209271B7|nr:TIGR01620 family protein [Aliihoeflea aestuarii]MCO6390642.1 TIGR01620 family protein [Aliihoeflea aestuarii]
MSREREPQSFSVPGQRSAVEAEPPLREPRALSGGELGRVEEAEIDVFDVIDADAPPPLAPRRRRGLRLGRIFAGAFGLLVSLAVGLWADRVIADLFARSEALGFIGLALAAVAVLALLAILTRETLALMRLQSVENLRIDADRVLRDGRLSEARSFVGRLKSFLATRPETAAGRAALDALADDVMDAGDLVGLAETELVAPLDAEARRLILDAAKRVSVVTAVSPRALVDIAYILFESGRLIRRLAELYGARPGTLGYFKLLRNVLAHLAVTGVMAVGDEFVHQVVGQGLAARLSAKLGEGVVNGVMTVRVGLAAMEVVRPLRFRIVKRPTVADFIGSLATFATRRERENPSRA